MEKIWLKHYPEGVPAKIDADAYPSILSIFQRSVAQFAARPAFSNKDTTLTFADIDRLSRNFAAFLQQSKSIGKGSCVAIMMPNLLQYPVALFGIIRTGAKIVNINPLYTQRELEHQLVDSGADAIVIFSEAVPVLTALIDGTEVETVVVTGVNDLASDEGGMGGMNPYLIAFNSALAEGQELELDTIEIASNDVAFLQYTGGTTGPAKGAILTHRNIVANLMQFSAVVAPELEFAEETIVTALPLYHIFGLTVNCLGFVYLGGHNVLITNPRDLRGFVEEVAKHRVSVWNGVNTLFNSLLNTDGFTTLDFSALKLCVGGGAAVQSSVAEKWAKVTGCPILEGYGLSETSPLLTFNPVDAKQFSGSIGIPVPSTDISLRDDQGVEVPEGEVGELCTLGPQVMKGYWQCDEATQEVMTEDGYFKTGDIARVDENGFFYIVDRKKDMVLVSGFNVFPNEVEAVVAECDGVLECACVGVKDAKSGEAVKLFVVAKPRADLSVEDIRAHCKNHLTSYKQPKYVEFMEALPKSNVGKILRRELREIGYEKD